MSWKKLTVQEPNDFTFYCKLECKVVISKSKRFYFIAERSLNSADCLIGEYRSLCIAGWLAVDDNKVTIWCLILIVQPPYCCSQPASPVQPPYYSRQPIILPDRGTAAELILIYAIPEPSDLEFKFELNFVAIARVWFLQIKMKQKIQINRINYRKTIFILLNMSAWQYLA